MTKDTIKNLFDSKKRQYDNEEIDKFVKNLYQSADWSVISYTALGILLGGSLGYGSFKMITMAIGSSAIGGMIGYQLGLRSAYKQKAEAQLALCQVEIEKSVRAK
jgi:hypothetical protein